MADANVCSKFHVHFGHPTSADPKEDAVFGRAGKSEQTCRLHQAGKVSATVSETPVSPWDGAHPESQRGQCKIRQSPQDAEGRTSNMRLMAFILHAKAKIPLDAVGYPHLNTYTSFVQAM